MGLVWGLSEITLKSALRHAWQVGASDSSCFFASWLGRHCTTLQRGPPTPTTLLGERQILACQRWTNSFMKNTACDFSVQALKTPKLGRLGGLVG